MSKIVNEAATIILLLTAIIIVGFYYSSQFILSILFVIVIALILVQKIYTDEEIDERKTSENRFMLVFSEKIGAATAKVQTAIDEVSRNSNNITEKLYEMKHLYDVESSQQYRELAQKIIEVENRLEEVKKNMSIGISAFDDRLKFLEEKIL